MPEEISYAGNYLGYGPGQHSMGGFLSSYLAKKETRGGCNIQATQVLKVFTGCTLRSKIKKKLEGDLGSVTITMPGEPTPIHKGKRLQPLPKRAYRRNEEWVMSLKNMNNGEGTTGNPSFGRSPYDVFLTERSGPLLGVKRPLRVVQTGRGRNKIVAQEMNKQLTDFEKRHQSIMNSTKSAEMGAKVMATLKTSRVKQMISLKRSPLPVLFKDVSPLKIQTLYASVVGCLEDPLTLSAFSNLLVFILKPEPPLNESTVQWIFSAIDKNGSGSVDFVEFISVLFTLVVPQAIQDTVTKLYHHLNNSNPITREHLSKHNILAGVGAVCAKRTANVDSPNASRRMQSIWKITAAIIAEAVQDLLPTDRISKDELVVLFFSNEKIMAQLEVCPL